MDIVMSIVFGLFVLSGVIQISALCHMFFADKPSKETLKKYGNWATIFIVLALVFFIIAGVTGL